jgi:hypothetical protein
MRNLASMNAMQSLVHDYWFDLEQARHDALEHTFTIQLGKNKKGPYQRTVTVTDVSKVDVIDEANIGIYDLNKITAKTGCVELLSHFPLKIRLSVGEAAELSLQDEEGISYYVPIFRIGEFP